MIFRTRSERNFLLDRVAYGDYNSVGRSSNELVRCAIERDEPDPDKFPLDTADLGRCYQTYERAPRHLRKRMEPILLVYSSHVLDRKANR